MKVYLGRLEGGEYRVRITDDGAGGAPRGGGGHPLYELPPRPELFKAAPPPFRWGEQGPGAIHLAAALLADLLGQDLRRIRAALPYFRRFLGGLPRDGFEISESIFRAFLEAVDGTADGSPGPGGGPPG